MSPWIMPFTHFIHVMGTVVWIGGIMMTVLVILPSSKTALESGPIAGKLMKEVAKRFTPLANLSIFFLILTGIAITYSDRNVAPVFEFGDFRAITFSLKLTIVALMVLIHFYRGLILNPKITKTPAQGGEAQVARWKKTSLDLVKANLVLGILVVMLAAVSLSR